MCGGVRLGPFKNRQSIKWQRVNSKIPQSPTDFMCMLKEGAVLLETSYYSTGLLYFKVKMEHQ